MNSGRQKWKQEDRLSVLHDITYMWNLKKNYTNELMYKTKNRLTDTEKKFTVTKGEMG